MSREKYSTLRPSDCSSPRTPSASASVSRLAMATSNPALASAAAAARPIPRAPPVISAVAIGCSSRGPDGVALAPGFRRHLRAKRPKAGQIRGALHDQRSEFADSLFRHTCGRAGDADGPDRNPIGPGMNRSGDRGYARFGLVQCQPVPTAGSRSKVLQQRADRSDHVRAVAIRVLESPVSDHLLNGLVGPQGGEPRFSAGRRVQGHHSRGFRGLIEKTPGGTLGVRDPDQGIAVDDSKPRELATLVREAVQQRLADVGNARGHIEPLPENGEPHRKAVETGAWILLRPPEVDQRGEEPMRAALRQRQAIGDLAQRHVRRPFREQLDDREAAFCGYVGHLRQRKNAISASIWPECMSEPETWRQPWRMAWRM